MWVRFAILWESDHWNLGLDYDLNFPILLVAKKNNCLGDADLFATRIKE